MTLSKQIAERGSELAVNLKEMCLRVPNMDHVGATYYETRFTNDLLARESLPYIAERLSSLAQLILNILLGSPERE